MNQKQRSEPTMVTSIISLQMLEMYNGLYNIEESWEKYAASNPDDDPRVLEVGHVSGVQKYVKYCLNAIKVNWMPGLNEPLLTISVKSLKLDCWNQDGMAHRINIDTFIRCKNGETLLQRSACPITTFADLSSVRHEGAGLVFSLVANLPDTTFFYVPKWVTDLETKLPYEVIEIPEEMVIYVKEEDEQYFTPLVCRPGNLAGFTSAYCQKYGWVPSDVNIQGIFQYVNGNPRHVAWVDDSLFVTFVNRVFLVRMTTGKFDPNGPPGINVYLIDYEHCDK